LGKCATDADGLDDCARFHGDEADAGLRMADFPIESALTFWKNEYALNGFEELDDGF
jgi:hypothetical protein